MKYTKGQRIFAFIGIIILIGMYVITLILGLTGSEKTLGALMAAIACTVIVPTLIYGMMLMTRVLSGRGTDEGMEQTTNDAENNK